MKSLDTFARKPELLEIQIDAPDIVEEYGEPIVFYMKDYLDITTYFDFYRAQTENDDKLNAVFRKIILNKDGQPALKDGFALPVNLAVAVLSKVNENLGKSKTKSLMSETGNPPA
jgi:hypothetical protein